MKQNIALSTTDSAKNIEAFGSCVININPQYTIAITATHIINALQSLFMCILPTSQLNGFNINLIIY